MAEFDKEAAAERLQARTKELTDKLEAGMKELYNSDKYKDYLKSMSHFHNYSSRNIMLIHQQMPKATRIASYRLWEEKFNRQVRKGEKGLYIYAPVSDKTPETKLMEKLDPETGAPLLDDNGNVIMEEMTAVGRGVRFKPVPVFDVSQTYGDSLPELVENLTGNVAHYNAFLDTLKAVSPLPVVFEPMQANQDGYCRYGEKIAVRENMSEILTVCAIVHEITHARLHDKQTAAEKDAFKSTTLKEIEAESISYVVCQHYGVETSPNSFGYLAEYGSRDMTELKASIDTIRKESNNLINAIDERFGIICKERGIDLTAKEAEQAMTTPVNTDPSYSTESRTENIAGVDFEFQDVIPETAEKLPVGYLYFVSSDEKIPYYSDNEIIEAYKKELDSLSIQGVEFQDIADNTLRKKLFDVYRGEFGEISEQPAQDESNIIMPDLSIGFSEMNLYGYTAEDMLPLKAGRAADLYNQDVTIYLLYPGNNEAMAYELADIEMHGGIFGITVEDWQKTTEYRALGELSPNRRESALESDFIHGKEDAFAIYQLVDGVERARDYRFEGLDYVEKHGWEVSRNHYVLVCTTPLPKDETLDEIFQKYNIDCPKDFPGHSLSVSDVVVLNRGGDITSHYVDRFGFTELPAFLGVEKQRENAPHTAQEIDTSAGKSTGISAKTTGMANTDTPQDTGPAIAKSEVPIYKMPVDKAIKDGEIEAYHASWKASRECGRAIDQAITDSNYELYHYDLKTAAKTVIDEYGLDRVAWVLATNVNHHDWDGRLSSANKAWAKELEAFAKPDYHLQTHLTILDGFVDRFREVAGRKPSLLDTLERNERKSREQTATALQPGKDKPKKSNREEL